jgi:GTPase SAR1 family protein
VVGNDTLRTLQVLASYTDSWHMIRREVTDADCFQRREARALRVCMLLWTQEHADGLPFTEIPIEVVRRGTTSTKAYISSLHISREIVLRRKICLVGSSGAGKTSFVKSITCQQPQLEHVDDRTIGIDHFPLHLEQRVASHKETRRHEVTFWDFAGQDAYQVAHSLFFSPRTLFLVCVNLEAFTVAFLQASIMADLRKQEIQLMNEFIDRTMMRWIRMIVARQPDAEFVFIATKADLLQANQATERLLKQSLLDNLKEVEAVVEEMRRKLKAAELNTLEEVHCPTPGQRLQVAEESHEPSVVFVSCTSTASVKAARIRVEGLIVESGRSFHMPDTYKQALDAIIGMRKAAKSEDLSTRINRVFARVDSLPAALKMEPELCRTVLQTLHDLGDVLWYEDLGVELFQNTAILDPLVLLDFVRPVINHTHAGVTMPHADLKSLPFWVALSDHKQMKAMKHVLQMFRLVYPAESGGVMEWDSDLIVPASWQTRTPAAWLFLGDILRIKDTKSCEGEAVRVHWEYHFEFGLPASLFDHVGVASVSPYFKFDAGPDRIVYEEQEIAACRIMVGRDPKSLHRTIHVEAVVAEEASEAHADKLWASFQQLCGAFVSVLHGYPGLVVSSFAWDDDRAKINLKRLVRSAASTPSSAKWMPPPVTWEWLQRVMAVQERSQPTDAAGTTDVEENG